MEFSRAFGLTKTQAELDFVDVDLERDAPLFVDPFAISQRLDSISQACHLTLQAFFQRIVDAIRAGDEEDAQGLLLQLREPNETRLGYSTHRPVDGVARDKLSDLTTNIIRGHLAEYTREQCALFGIPVRPTALPLGWRSAVYR